MSTIPHSHIEDAQKLEADAYIELFKLRLFMEQVLYFKADKGGVWQDNTYEGVALSMTGMGAYADQQVARPKLTIQNPDAVYSTFINQGTLERAEVTRYRVKRTDYEADLPIFVSQVWYVGRVTMLTRLYFSVELRAIGDNPNFTIPSRTFSPPEFPSVSIR
jgi:phage-related protein